MKKLLFALFLVFVIFTGLYASDMGRYSRALVNTVEMKSIVIDIDEKSGNLIKGTVISGNDEFGTGDEVMVTFTGTDYMLSGNVTVKYRDSLNNVISAYLVQNVEWTNQRRDVL